MKIITEKTLKDFLFWGGALDHVKCLTDEELETIESILEECYPEGLTQTDINDFFWFENDTIAEWLGYESFEEIYNR